MPASLPQPHHADAGEREAGADAFRPSRRAGTDPALWSVLSGEERAFFAKAGAMGPLTYGRAFQEMKIGAAARVTRRPLGREDLR